jgi:hypothetical protein
LQFQLEVEVREEVANGAGCGCVHTLPHLAVVGPGVVPTTFQQQQQQR